MGGRVAGFLSAPVWHSGFRPFFLAAAFYGPLAIPAVFLSPGMPAALWHGHELIFGFAVAVICGFVLTALPSWAGAPPVVGGRLALLVAAWLAGRIAVWLAPALPLRVVATIDLLAPALLAALVLPGLLAARRRVFLALPVVLAALVVANLVFYLALARNDHYGAGQALGTAIQILMVLFAVVSGFLTPIFSESALQAEGWTGRIRFVPAIEALAIVTVVGQAAAVLLVPGTVAAALAAALACAVHALRLARWQGWRARRIPVVWVMHLGYGWLVAAFGLRALAEAGLGVPPQAALHAFTVGALGLMMIGLMARIALRHTGRSLKPAPVMVAAFGLMFLAAVLRTLATFLDGPDPWLLASAALWAAPFLVYAATYGRVLLSPSLPRAPAGPPVYGLER